MTPAEKIAHGAAILSVAVRGDAEGLSRLLGFENADTTISALVSAGVTLAEVPAQYGGPSASSVLARVGMAALDG